MEPQGKLNDVDWPAGREKVPPAGRFSLSVGKRVVKRLSAKKRTPKFVLKMRWFD